MIIPIRAYGDPVLKKMGQEIQQDYAGLSELISNMFETMNNAQGVGLAAPQIGLAIRLFVLDASAFAEDDQENKHLQGYKKVFINPQIMSQSGEEWSFEEGCLSIPTIREEVIRKPQIELTYYDENFNKKVEKFDGIVARIIQHEYDHIEGVLFTDHLSALKKRLLKKKLMQVSKGAVSVAYKMKFNP